jgi:hypothetical protein
MRPEDAEELFSKLSEELQLKCLTIFGHNLTIAARDTYAFQSPEVRAPRRIREINEIQHRIFNHILALCTPGSSRYSDDALISIMLDHEDEHLRDQCLWAIEDALNRAIAA